MPSMEVTPTTSRMGLASFLDSSTSIVRTISRFLGIVELVIAVVRPYWLVLKMRAVPLSLPVCRVVVLPTIMP